MGVVVRRYIDILTIIINFPYSTCISFFGQQHPYFFVHLKNVFSVFVKYNYQTYVTVHAKTFRKSAKSFFEIRADLASPIFSLPILQISCG